jgi:TPR repeat protein
MRRLFLVLALLLGIYPICGWAQTAKERYDKILQLEASGKATAKIGWDSLNSGKGDEMLKASADAVMQQTDEEVALEKIANSGDVEARYYMGLLRYHYGLEYESNARSDPSWVSTATEEFKKAVGWWKPLAEQGSAGAQWNYGTAFAEGRGVPQSPSNAIEWWYKAANQFRSHGDREDALTLFDMMKKLDPANPYVIKLQRALFPADK